MTTSIKKDYQEIVAFLQANEGKKVASILPTIIEMVSSKAMASTVKYDEQGNVAEVFCYYHKEWEKVSEVEYGKKAGTKTGLNTMCKQGVSQWTKQQREAKTKQSQLLLDVANGVVDSSELPAKLAEIEAERVAIVPRVQE